MAKLGTGCAGESSPSWETLEAWCQVETELPLRKSPYDATQRPCGAFEGDPVPLRQPLRGEPWLALGVSGCR
jgi:hypothetical protein